MSTNTHEPRLMGYADIPAAADTNLAAFKDDPLHKYMTETPDSHNTIVHYASRKGMFCLMFTGAVNKGTALTVDDGASVVIYSTAKESEPRWSLNHLFDWIMPYLLFYNKVLTSKEQSKRQQEFREKARKAITETLGARKDTMMSINIACTDPAQQGHGYGSKLIKVVLAKADENKCAVWLMSINRANTGFYNYLGFKTVKEVLIGEDNPTWTEPPIIMDLMVREFVDLQDKTTTA